jgi:AraC family transcriptional activator FtrA
MKRFILRVVVYLLSFLVIVGGVGFVGYSRSQKGYWYSGYDRSFPTVKAVKIPEYKPNKPTVAVILGNATTEVFDFMVPYEMFSMTDAFNVFAVAPDNNVKRITGGLELIPHYSFKELDQLLGKSPDIIVIPYMTMVEKEGYQPVREWILKHSSDQTTVLSICVGAENLADTGLLKGKSAAIHWQVFDLIKRKYRDT